MQRTGQQEVLATLTSKSSLAATPKAREAAAADVTAGCEGNRARYRGTARRLTISVGTDVSGAAHTHVANVRVACRGTVSRPFAPTERRRLAHSGEEYPRGRTAILMADSNGKQPKPSHVVSNERNVKLEIQAKDGSVLILEPLETKRRVTEDEVTRYCFERWSDFVRIEKTEAEPSRLPSATSVAVGLGVWFAVPWGITAAFVGAPRWWLLGWAGLVATFLLAAAVDLIRSKVRDGGFRDARSWSAQQLNLFVSFILGFALPAITIYFASDGTGLIEILHRQNDPNTHLAVLTVIGRSMQILFVAIAALLPSLLYFLFDREHLGTVRDRFIRNIMRFDPTITTRHDADDKYGRLMDEAYGDSESGRFLPQKRVPVLLATLVLALGWTFTLLHGDVRLLEERGITGLFEPRGSAVAFAFLGAYFYGLTACLRAYGRRDLRPKSYSALTTRVVSVVILAWVLERFWSGTTLYVLAFVAGIVPESALVLVTERLRAIPKAWGGESLREPDPLTRLEGVDLYDRSRLYDEGVNNIESLAHHDLVGLMLQTRIPAPRLVDWVDQAILYLHAGREATREHEGRLATLQALRHYGIRTATDVDNALESPECGLFSNLDGTNGLSRLRMIRDVMQDEEWMPQLRNWRKTADTAPVRQILDCSSPLVAEPEVRPPLR